MTRGLALASVDAFAVLHRAFLRIGALDLERRRAWDTIEHAQTFVLTTGLRGSAQGDGRAVCAPAGRTGFESSRSPAPTSSLAGHSVGVEQQAFGGFPGIACPPASDSISPPGELRAGPPSGPPNTPLRTREHGPKATTREGTPFSSSSGPPRKTRQSVDSCCARALPIDRPAPRGTFPSSSEPERARMNAKASPMERWKAAILRLAAVVGCGGILLACDATPTRRTEISDEIRSYWSQGQQSLISEGWTTRAELVHPDQFRFEQRPGPFTCGSIENAYGCFWADDRLIEWWDVRVIIHESRHAILWRLGDSRWRCVDHDPECKDK